MWRDIWMLSKFLIVESLINYQKSILGAEINWVTSSKLGQWQRWHHKVKFLNTQLSLKNRSLSQAIWPLGKHYPHPLPFVPVLIEGKLHHEVIKVAPPMKFEDANYHNWTLKLIYPIFIFCRIWKNCEYYQYPFW